MTWNFRQSRELFAGAVNQRFIEVVGLMKMDTETYSAQRNVLVITMK